MQKILRRAVALIALAVASVPAWAQEASATVETSGRDSAAPARAGVMADVGATVSALAAHAAQALPQPDRQASPPGPPEARGPAGRTEHEAAVRPSHAAPHHDRASRQRLATSTARISLPPASPAPAGSARAREARAVEVVGAAGTGPYGDINETRCTAEVTTAV